jgi:hypothetical protein
VTITTAAAATHADGPHHRDFGTRLMRVSVQQLVESVRPLSGLLGRRVPVTFREIFLDSYRQSVIVIFHHPLSLLQR